MVKMRIKYAVLLAMAVFLLDGSNQLVHSQQFTERKQGTKQKRSIRQTAVRRERYRIVDSGQNRCYGNKGLIAFPKAGAAFYGQDAQYQGYQFAFQDNKNGCVTDLNTGLVWQKSPDFVKRDFAEAKKYASELKLGGYEDWRIPSIKELFSIADFSGSILTMRPYIDTNVFDFEYPDTSKGWRIIDAQYRSNTVYLGITMAGDRAGFGFNFADGRIKGYPISGPGARHFGAGKQYIRCVRGPRYGENDFVDNHNGTVTDRATGLMWTKSDSPKPMNWQQALAYAENLNYAGYSDWRLPNIKELQSIIDYSRAPDASDPKRRGAAIDPIFKNTIEEPWCWSSTTHLDNYFGYYVCFGRALSARKWKGKQMDAHGAGAVRSDPKAGSPASWPNGLGPQSDEIRIYNYVRCVRGGKAKHRTIQPAAIKRRPVKNIPSAGKRWVTFLDKDKDGKVSKTEFDGPPVHFTSFDKNKDGFIDESEAPTGPPPRSFGRRK